MENNCNESVNITSYLFINTNDVKFFDKENGLVLKRKYGNKTRTVFKYEINEETNTSS